MDEFWTSALTGLGFTGVSQCSPVLAQAGNASLGGGGRGGGRAGLGVSTNSSEVGLSRCWSGLTECQASFWGFRCGSVEAEGEQRPAGTAARKTEPNPRHTSSVGYLLC